MILPDLRRLRLMGDQELEALVLRLAHTVSAMGALWSPAARKVRAGYEDALDAARAELARRETP